MTPFHNATAMRWNQCERLSGAAQFGEQKRRFVMRLMMMRSSTMLMFVEVVPPHVLKITGLNRHLSCACRMFFFFLFVLFAISLLF